MGALSVFAALLTGAVSVAGLYRTRHDASDEFTRHGRLAIALIILSTLVAVSSAIANWRQLGAEQRKADEFEALVAQAAKELENANAWARDVQAANAQLTAALEILQRQVTDFRSTLHNAQEATIAGMPQRIDEAITNKWNNGVIVLKLKTFTTENMQVPPIGVTDLFNGDPFAGSDRKLRIELVNMRPDDMMTLAFNLSTHSYWGVLRYYTVTPFFKHGDVVSIVGERSTSYAVRMASKYRSTLQEILQRNPNAGIRIRVLD